ncbi:Vitamin B12 transporter BtuB [subsurface metagenome]
MSFNANYTRTEAKDKDTDADLLRRPKQKFSANLNYNFQKKANINLTFIRIGEQDDMDFSAWPSTRLTLPGYSLLNAAVSFNFTSSFQIFCRLDNILNKEYEMIKGYGTPGFSVYGGVNFFL